LSLTDQHGRRWSSQADLKTGMPCTPLFPDFSAPWIPTPQFLRVNPQNPTELWINYTAMFRERAALLDIYHESAVSRARAAKLAVPTRKGEYSPELLNLMGAMPNPVEPVIAAQQENPFILGPDWCAENGRRWKVDPRLERFCRQPRNTLTAQVLGMDFSAQSYEQATADSGEIAAAAQSDAYAWMKQEPGADVPELSEESKERLAQMEAEAAERLAKRAEEAERMAAANEDAFKTMGADEDTDKSAEELLDDVDDEDLEDDGSNATDLDEEYDAEAVGGRVVNPKAARAVAKQAPRRPTQTTRKKGESALAAQKRAQREGRRSIADGAKPVIGSR
jgi:hypothetical protein